MRAVARFITKVADLVEAEGRALRRSSVAVALAAALALAAGLVGVGGVGLVAWGLFEALRSATGVIVAAFICGVFLLMCAGGLIWTVIRLGRRGR